MATFNEYLKSKNKKGIYKVYIRCTHNRESKYISTEMYVHECKVQDRKIKDAQIMAKCGAIILDYMKKLNLEDNINNWSCQDVVDFLVNDKKNIPFYPFCDTFISAMYKDGRGKLSSFPASLIVPK